MSGKMKKVKSKITPVVDVITIILVILFIAATIFLVFLMRTEQTVEVETQPLVESKVLMLMQSTGKLDILKDIYGVYDDTSYNKMKNSELIGSKVKEAFFSGESYVGNYSSKPTITLSGSRFNPDASNLVTEYYTTVVVEYNNEVTKYNVVVDYIDNVLIELRQIP